MLVMLPYPLYMGLLSPVSLFGQKDLLKARSRLFTLRVGIPVPPGFRPVSALF